LSPATEGAKVSLCEKALLYSFRCNFFTLSAADPALPGEWQHLAARVHTRGLGETGRWPGPTLKLSLVYPGEDGRLDIDLVRLNDRHGRDLLRNGSFDSGLDGWLPATDRDLAWHIHQTPVETFFAAGLLGLVALTVAVLAALKTLVAGFRGGDPCALAMIAGLSGFLAVGMLGSTLDAARTGFAFHLLVLTALAVRTPGYAEASTPTALRSDERSTGALARRAGPA
jgi:hypothetical protein